MPDIVAFAAHVADVLGLPAGLANHLELRLVSTAAYRKKDGSLPDPDPVFLSSLIASDLKRVADAAPLGFGRALASYLSDPEPKSGRLDVRTADGRRRVLAGLDPAAFPPARWPAAVGLVEQRRRGEHHQGTPRGHRDRRGVAARPARRPADGHGVEAPGADGGSRPADYFADQATALLGEPDWGLLAAALGNAEKRADFRDRFWFRDSGMRAKLRELRGATRPGDWPTGVDRFTAALGIARTLVEERGEVAVAWQSPVSEADLTSARQSAADAERELDRADADCSTAQAVLASLQQDAVTIQAGLDGHLADRPGGLLGRLGIGRAMTDWRDRAAELEGQLDELDRDQRAARLAETRARRASDAARPVAESAADRLRLLEARQRADAERVERARRDWGASFPEDWLSLPEDDQQRPRHRGCHRR